MHMHTHTHTHINTQAHTHGEILMTQVASDTAPHESSARQLPVNQSGMLSRPSWHLSCAISMVNNSSLFSVLMSAHRSLHLRESSQQPCVIASLVKSISPTLTRDRHQV